jgi:8-oxo-dGTP pyrophosphatase MutT (NUDIX family)
MPSPSFRAGVVIVVRGGDGRLLAFERVDLPGQWQLPQGGLKKDEEPIDTAWRELAEETRLGPSDVTAAGEYPNWVIYEYPPEIRATTGRLGQAQRWFFFDAVRPDLQPTPDGREFSSWQWVTKEWLLEHAVAFRKPAYELVLNAT